MSRLRANDGFTVIELAVAAAISLVILAPSMTVFIAIGRRASAERHADATQPPGRATDRLARQLRNLASPADVITAARAPSRSRSTATCRTTSSSRTSTRAR